MSINYLRGFRRLGWVLSGLCLPVVIFISHQHYQEFAGYDQARISQLSYVIEHGKTVKLTDIAPTDKVIEILKAERNGTLDAGVRDVVEEMRRRRAFPYGWELETRRTNWRRVALTTVLAQAAIIVLVQGTIAVVAWVLRGFAKE
jgi:hypothetical protein